MNLHDPTHPVWSLLRLLMTIIGTFMVAAGIEGFTQYTRARQKGE